MIVTPWTRVARIDLGLNLRSRIVVASLFSVLSYAQLVVFFRLLPDALATAKPHSRIRIVRSKEFDAKQIVFCGLLFMSNWHI